MTGENRKNFKRNTVFGIIIIVILASFLSMFYQDSSKKSELPVISKAPEFSLINQDNKTVTMNSYKVKNIKTEKEEFIWH